MPHTALRALCKYFPRPVQQGGEELGKEHWSGYPPLPCHGSGKGEKRIITNDLSPVYLQTTGGGGDRKWISSVDPKRVIDRLILKEQQMSDLFSDIQGSLKPRQERGIIRTPFSLFLPLGFSLCFPHSSAWDSGKWGRWMRILASLTGGSRLQYG